MQAKYRTSENIWSILEYPVITVEQHDAGFVICGYASVSDIHVDMPRAGIHDVQEFEVFYDESQG